MFRRCWRSSDERAADANSRRKGTQHPANSRRQLPGEWPSKGARQAGFDFTSQRKMNVPAPRPASVARVEGDENAFPLCRLASCGEEERRMKTRCPIGGAVYTILRRSTSFWPETFVVGRSWACDPLPCDSAGAGDRLRGWLSGRKAISRHQRRGRTGRPSGPLSDRWVGALRAVGGEPGEAAMEQRGAL